jgi:hypothetical protein
MNDERENLSWQVFGEASRELAKVIAADGFVPDLILSIARGGLFLAGSLGYALAVKNLYVMNVEFYDGVGTTLDMPVMLPPVPSAVDFSAKKVLIADDVADTGRTIELVHTFIKDQVEDVRSAVIYEKSQSVIKCEYVWKRTDRWINFPWSSEAPVVEHIPHHNGRDEQVDDGGDEDQHDYRARGIALGIQGPGRDGRERPHARVEHGGAREHRARPQNRLLAPGPGGRRGPSRDRLDMEVGGEDGQFRVGPRPERLAHPLVEFVFGQHALHERGLEGIDHPPAIGVRRAEFSAAPVACGCHLITRPCHHGASPPA